MADLTSEAGRVAISQANPGQLFRDPHTLANQQAISADLTAPAGNPPLFPVVGVPKQPTVGAD